jgi:hypothetical protein
MLTLLLRVLGAMAIISLGFVFVVRALCYISDVWARCRWARDSNRLARASREEQIRRTRPSVTFQITEPGKPPEQ